MKASAELTAEERIEQLRRTTEEMITSRTEYVESTRCVDYNLDGDIDNLMITITSRTEYVESTRWVDLDGDYDNLMLKRLQQLQAGLSSLSPPSGDDR